ncbi:MAG: CvpA family protein, partial [Flavobacteriales bacterium]|nr:CvpA family protein [Flavobacteriales bacterium]
MNWIDWVLLAAIALAAFKGWSRGFIVEVGSLVALVAGVWAGIHLSDQVVDWLGL